MKGRDNYMGQLKYNGNVVNSAVSQLNNISNNWNSLIDEMKNATNNISCSVITVKAIENGDIELLRKVKELKLHI